MQWTNKLAKKVTFLKKDLVFFYLKLVLPSLGCFLDLTSTNVGLGLDSDGVDHSQYSNTLPEPKNTKAINLSDQRAVFWGCWSFK